MAYPVAVLKGVERSIATRIHDSVGTDEELQFALIGVLALDQHQVLSTQTYPRVVLQRKDLSTYMLQHFATNT